MTAALDLDRLLTVARAATLYPNRPENGWMIDPDVETTILAPKQPNGWDGIAICREVHTPADARFISTFDPPTCEALLLRLQDAEQERDRERDNHGSCDSMSREMLARTRDQRDEARAALAALRESVTALCDSAEREGHGITIWPGHSEYHTVETGLLRALTGSPEETGE